MAALQEMEIKLNWLPDDFRAELASIVRAAVREELKAATTNYDRSGQKVVAGDEGLIHAPNMHTAGCDRDDD